MPDFEPAMRAARLAMGNVIGSARDAFVKGRPAPAAADLLASVKGAVEAATKCPVICGADNHDVAALHPFVGPIFAQIELEPGTHRVVRFFKGVVE